MKTPTFTITEQSDDVSDVDAKAQNVLSQDTDFYSFTAQSMLKTCPPYGRFF